MQQERKLNLKKRKLFEFVEDVENRHSNKTEEKRQEGPIAILSADTSKPLQIVQVEDINNRKELGRLVGGYLEKISKDTDKFTILCNQEGCMLDGNSAATKLINYRRGVRGDVLLLSKDGSFLTERDLDILTLEFAKGLTHSPVKMRL